MRIELSDGMGYLYQCESRSMKVLSEWFREWLPTMLSANASYPPWQIRVWPTDQTEAAYIKRSPMFNAVTPDEMEELAETFINAANIMRKKQKRVNG